MRWQLTCALGLLAALLSGCDPCRNLDCVSDNDDGQFRLVSAASGADLLFGPGQAYRANTLRFYTVSGTDTTYFETKALRFPGNGYDSILLVRFFPRPDTVYLRLTATDTDTLQLAHRTYTTRCCGTVTEISSFRYNNAVDLPGNQGTQTLRK